MLVSKRLYCLFPLVCVVLHSIMFSMVRASPMESLEGFGGTQKDAVDWLMNDDYSGSASNEAVQHMMDELAQAAKPPPKSQRRVELDLSNMIEDADPIKKELITLVLEIQRLKLPGSEPIRKIINYATIRFYDFGNRGQPILNAFLESSPTITVRQNELKDIIPLFVTDYHIYFLAKLVDYSLLPSEVVDAYYVFTRAPNENVSFMYGKIRSGLTPEEIRQWGRENNFL